MRFKDKVVFVTGGSRGLGKALVSAFLKEGAIVGTNGRDKGRLEALKNEYAEKGNLVVYEGDISDYQRIEEISEDFAGRHGRVDVLINNAAVINPILPSEKLKKEDFERVIDVNIKGTFYVTYHFGKKMLERKRGRIINIASQAALFGEKGFLPYAVSKAAIISMTRILGYEWAQKGVTVCALAPGFIKGGMNESLIKREIFVDFLSKRTPLGRMAEIHEFVSLVLFLASEEAQYINGETIVLDGGMTGYTGQPFLDFLESLKK
ncbi:MAG: SDR family oxidoreductase [Desulfobacterota bacterium]|nr:SDR family oxidoreductase [Thermodesulfobacteriota bacterium]MDW8002625.1 SDR family oxidoreductase [Deltaproteobacteria bacterium]